MSGTAALLQTGAEGDGIDWTQVIVTLTVTVGVIFTAVFSFLGVRFGRAARTEAQETQRSNTLDHGRVVQALNALRRDTTAALDAVRHDIHDLREAHVRHLEHHVENGER